MIEALLELIAGSEFALANLFERDDGQWQANLRLRELYTTNAHGQKIGKRDAGQEWGLGSTPYAALTAAMERVRET